ncbi:putative bifunctional diguanylate cyclase/phosphodiesterase [Streptomyces sp. NPDC091281]|uniref:putative bifunctional diguanylate cyclase/phosphodiesterase n=1 Tax=Streptomyces sp. NPDC091281 TaxID=3365985 RepID=UPI0038157E2E
MSSPPTLTTLLDGTPRTQPPAGAPGAPLARPPASRGGSNTVHQLLLALICAGYAVGSALGWGSPELALVMGDFGLSAAAATAAVSCFLHARTGVRFRLAWLLFALSSTMAALGNLVWGWYEVVLDQPVPSPSYADLFFLCFAPPAIIGLLVLAARPVSRAGWVCLALDAWLIAGSLLTLSWSLALAQAAKLDRPSVGHAALSLAYPLLDIALVSMVLVLHFRRSAINRAAVNTAVSALALTVMCDALFTSPLMHNNYRSGQLLDAGWFAGSLLLAYAPWAARRHHRALAEGHTRVVHEHRPGPRGGDHPHEPPQPQPHAQPTGHPAAQKGGQPPPPGADSGGPLTTRPITGSLAALTPYLAAAVCTLGILYNVLNGRSVDRVVLLTGGAVVLALVVRQGIMLLDNIALTQELAHKENHFRSLVQGSSDVIMIAAPSGVLRYVSPAAAGVYGRPAEDLVGTELAQLIHPDDFGCVVHEVRRFLAADPQEEPTTRIECRFRSGDASASRAGGTAPGPAPGPGTGSATGSGSGPAPGAGSGAGGVWLNVESTVKRHHGGLIFNSRDVTERVRLQAQLQHNAEHDPLTDLPNRALFTTRVQQALSGRRSSDRGSALRNTAVLFIDLDGFKAVNDTIGHQAGDELLIQAARRLQEAVRQGDTASRLGGDEFAALIVGDGTRDRAARERHILELADRLRLTLSQPYLIDGNDVRVAASIGVAFAESGLGAGELLRNADLAMYRAKAGGKGRVELYRPQMQQDVVRKAELATRLRAALHDGEFALLHQPVVRLSDGRISSVAAQPRWRSSQGVLFTPAEFLRVADDGDRTAELSRWVLEQAVEQAADRAAGGVHIPVVVSVAARRLLDRSLPLGSLEALLTRYGLPSGSLVIELSDIDARVPLEDLERRLGALRRLGVRIALDGFGGGVAITALRRLPIDILKLDRGLVEGVVESARLHKITSGLLRMAGDLGLQSVAEGVDLPEQVVALRAMGCTHGQGMAFAGPLDEYRLRRALGRGTCPVPSGPAEPVFAGSGTGTGGGGTGGPGAGAGGYTGAVTGGVTTVLGGGTLAGGGLGGTALRSHDETPVPPT